MKINFQTIKFNKTYTKTKQKTNPISFQAMRCNEKNFEIKRLKDLHCPICGLLMLDDTQQKTFIEDVANKKGDALKNALEKYEDESVFIKNQNNNRKKTIYRPQKQQIVNILKELALKYPTLSLAELVRIKSQECLKSLIGKQFIIMNELKDYIYSVEIPDKEKKAFFNVLNEYRNRAQGISDTRFKRKSFINDIQSTIKNPTIKQQVTKIAIKIPTSDNAIDAFFVKYSDSNRSNAEIASKLIKQTTPSTEHLIPKSKQGPNKTNNYICDCEECNSSRGNILFDEWIKNKKDIQKGLQQYLADVQKALDFGELNPKYDSYIEEIIETISQISHGKIKLTVPPTNNDEKKKTILEKRNAEINNISRKMSELIGKILSLKQEITELKEHPQYENITQYSITQTKITELKAKENDLRKKLSIAQKEKEACMDILEKISQLEQELKDHTDKNSDKIKTQIQSLNKSHQLAQLEENNNRIMQINEELFEIEKQIGNLTEKLNTLKKLINENSEPDLSLENIETTIKELESIAKEIHLIENSIFDKELLEERLASIQRERKELEDENKAIINRGKIDPKDDTEYRKYCHFEELYEAAEEIGEYYTTGNRILAQKALEIAQIAQNEIRKKVLELAQIDEVKYFANLTRLSENEEEEIIIKIRLEEIDEILPELEKLYIEYNRISQNKTLDEIETLYRKIKLNKTTQQKIINISNLTTELQNLEDTLSYNQKILGKLRTKYRALSSEEYRKLISLIYY